MVDGGGFKCFLFSLLFGEDYHFDTYFSDGLKPPTSYILLKKMLEFEIFLNINIMVGHRIAENPNFHSVPAHLLS